MDQLKMIWKPGNRGNVDYKLNDKFEICPLEFDMIDSWCAVSIDLTGRLWTRDEFISAMLFSPPLPLSPKNIICIREKETGLICGTASACIDPIKKRGNLHMVSVRADKRGLKLGHAVCAEAVKKFIGYGVCEADLSTDDFRVSAIAIYLKLGFYPYLYKEDMAERWKAILLKYDESFIL